MGELAHREGIAQPSMSQAVKRLVGEGLVSRTPSLDDARASELTITDAGCDVVSAFRTASVRELVPVFHDLSPGDIETLIRAAEILPSLSERLRENHKDD